MSNDWRGRTSSARAVLAVTALASVLTLTAAASVLRAPSERIFGMEFVGRHHDPFTVIDQFRRPIAVGMFSQPVTDVPGALLARATGPVAAYNWLVLITFPLAAAAAFLLATHLGLSRIGAAVASLAYAFSPFHFAHAAYHPHVAQTQWFPIYFLALWWCLDKGNPITMGVLAATTVGLTLSNFYAGLIAAVVSPVAIIAYWIARPTAQRSRRHLIATIGSLLCVAAGGLLYGQYFAPVVMAEPAAFAVPRGDLSRYGATWASYVIPPVQHPLFGEAARRIWSDLGVREGLLEQQLSLGFGILALGAVALWPSRWVRREQQTPLRRTLLVTTVGTAALVCSMAPDGPVRDDFVVWPSSLLHAALPMFRAYARFGVVVQLMAALLAGMGVDRLLRSGSRGAQVGCIALVMLVLGEYMISPMALSRDVLPTTAHRWVVDQPVPLRVLDCVELTSETASIPWLTDERVSVLGTPFDDCAEPNMAEKLAANGYTHLMVRLDAPKEWWMRRPNEADTLRTERLFADAELLAVSVPAPSIYTLQMQGFYPREHDRHSSWRWMGSMASWTIVNRMGTPIVAAVDIEMAAFPRSRSVDLQLDGRPAQRLIVGERRQRYRVGPLTLTPGRHELVFDAVEPTTVADQVLRNGDPRPLSIALGIWEWSEQGAPP